MNKARSDADLVDAAVECLIKKDLMTAESLLLDVISRTPENYSVARRSGDQQVIEFWDQLAFVHYVTWSQKEDAPKESIRWEPNAYPRAYYYLGFLSVKRKQFTRALEFLEKGQKLEPTNPKFILEKAQALVISGRKKEGIALYDELKEVGPHVTTRDLAIAERGRGFALIELDELDQAESAFIRSLKLEPNNEIAIAELQYIEHLRQGGEKVQGQSTPSEGPDLSKCAVCGEKFESGKVVNFEGMPIAICDRCDRKLTKKWWQFWK
jgi:tetratricopeptide (TPR) repeat protein